MKVSSCLLVTFVASWLGQGEAFSSPARIAAQQHGERRPLSRLYMQPTTTTKTTTTPTSSSGSKKERLPSSSSSSSDLAAFTTSYDSEQTQEEPWMILDTSFLEQFVLPVVSTALLITSNTVGASMLVLPELAAGPGMAISTAVLIAAYLLNWMSGLCIAQVAIQQYETSGSEVPSSFKEFAQANLWESSAWVVSAISIFVNALVLAFDTTKAGQVLQGIATSSSNSMASAAGGATADVAAAFTAATLSNDNVMAVLWATLMLGIVSTLNLSRLSQVASVMVVGVFVSFAGLLLPGLAHVQDPMAVLMSGPSSDGNVMASVLHMAPVFVTTLVYQNIVPTITRLLGYNRAKVVTAISLGSFLPLGIYVAWCVAVLGGGIDTGLDSGLFTLFSVVTVAGSSMGALMSLAEEFEILFSAQKKDVFSLASVALPSILALGVCQWFADDISGALKVAGSYGSPLLYGLIPVMMAYLQQQEQQKSATPTTTSVVPGGMAGLGVLGLGATALVGSELTATVSQVIVGS